MKIEGVHNWTENMGVVFKIEQEGYVRGRRKVNFVNCDLKARGYANWLLLVELKDEEGNKYDWCPKWRGELDKIVACSYLVELLNTGYEPDLVFEEIYKRLSGNKSLREAIEKAEEQLKKALENLKTFVRWKEFSKA